MDVISEKLIQTMNTWPPEVIWVLMLIICFITILGANRYYGPSGLFAYIAVSIIIANIQVLKAVQFSLYPEPVALGTILFSSTYLATDILGENYGIKKARNGVFMGLFAHLFFSLIMLFTLGFSPLTPEQAGEDMAWITLPRTSFQFIHPPIFFIFCRFSCLFNESIIRHLVL